MVLELTENTAAVTLRHIDHNENPPFFAIYESDTLTGHTKTKPVGSFSVCTFPKQENSLKPLIKISGQNNGSSLMV